ncbi:MAG: hypothetical protein NTW97_11865, partial [Candidatus Krumholzibacteria bacterium]|nr:hypothetical protein [Candidatus Krumholzibacteria bacterium]
MVLQIIGIESPESAYIAKSVDTPFQSIGVTVSEGFAYVADGDVMQIIDIDPLSSAHIIGAVDTSSTIVGITLS